MRQLRRRAGKDNFLQIHVSYVNLSLCGDYSVVTHLAIGAGDCRRTKDQTNTAGYTGCQGMLKSDLLFVVCLVSFADDIYSLQGTYAIIQWNIMSMSD